jgi:hypothetical protein
MSRCLKMVVADDEPDIPEYLAAGEVELLAKGSTIVARFLTKPVKEVVLRAAIKAVTSRPLRPRP